MVRLIKWLLGLILVVVVLLVAAVIVLPMVVDPNDYKPQIVNAAKERLGRDLAIEQELTLTVFPWLGIETGGVRLGNAPGFEAQNFAEVDRLGVRIKLLPLLSRRLEVDTLVLTGLRLNLEKDATGRTNWEDLAGTAQEAEAQESAEPGDDGPGVSLSVQGIQIEDARITWDDRQAGQNYVLDGVRLVTGALTPGVTVPVEAGVKFTSASPAMTLNADLTTKVSTNAGLTVFGVSALVLKLDAAGEGLPADGAKLTLRAEAAADTEADTLTVERFEITGPAMSASGEAAVAGLTTDPSATGRLEIAETNPKTLASMFAASIATTDPSAMTRASGNLTFDYREGALKLDPLAVSLDDSTLSGHLHLLDPAGPVVRTRLELDQIDLDRYMPPPGAEQPTGAEPEAAAPASPDATADPFAGLRSLDLVGEFVVGRLTVNKARMQDVKAKVEARQGVVKIDPMAANLYEGGFNGAATLDASAKTPKLSSKAQMTGIQVGPLLTDVAGFDRLAGRGELDLDINLVGLSEAEIRRTLNGNARFAFNDGAIKGVNIAQIIRDASQRLGLGSDRLDVGTPGQTDFSEISASVTMSNGVVKNSDLRGKSPLLRVEGKGEVDLPNDAIDYSVTTTLVGSLEGQGGKGKSELAGIPIPVRITGPLTAPTYQPDLEAALSAKAKAQLEEKKDEVKQKLEEKLDKELGGKLKGLFR